MTFIRRQMNCDRAYNHTLVGKGKEKYKGERKKNDKEGLNERF